jgi:hypothetical protein
MRSSSGPASAAHPHNSADDAAPVSVIVDESGSELPGASLLSQPPEVMFREALQRHYAEVRQHGLHSSGAFTAQLQQQHQRQRLSVVGSGGSSGSGGGGFGGLPSSSEGQRTVPALPRFPRASDEDPQYCNATVLVDRTRAELEALTGEAALKGMLPQLPAAPEVRRLVTRILAAPQDAEAIAEAEWRRRSAATAEARDELKRRMEAHFAAERAALDEELRRLDAEELRAQRA